MGLLSSLFGSESKAETETKPIYTPEQLAVLGINSDFLSQTGGPSGASSGAPSGDTVAGLSSGETTSLAGLEARAMQLATGSDPLTLTASKALEQILTRGPTDFEDYYDTNVFRPATDEFLEEILPDIGNKFGDQLFSGERRKAQSTATDDFLQRLLQSRSELAFNTRNSDTEAILAAAGLVPEIAGRDTRELISLLEPLSTRRNLDTTRRQTDFDNFLKLREAEDNRLAASTGLLGRPGQENITTVTGGSKGLIPGFLEAAAGTAGKAAGARVF